MVECLLCKQNVAGSNPTTSTNQVHLRHRVKGESAFRKGRASLSHFHVEYGGDEMLVRIEDAEPMAGDLPAKQKKKKKKILGWAVLRHDELMENWKLAEQKKELFQIDPMR